MNVPETRGKVFPASSINTENQFSATTQFGLWARSSGLPSLVWGHLNSFARQPFSTLNAEQCAVGGLNACSVVIKKYRTVCCSVKTNKGRLVRAAGGCGEGFGASESSRRAVCVCVCERGCAPRAYPKTGGEFLLKQTPGRERVCGSLRRRRRGGRGEL